VPESGFKLNSRQNGTVGTAGKRGKEVFEGGGGGGRGKRVTTFFYRNKRKTMHEEGPSYMKKTGTPPAITARYDPKETKGEVMSRERNPGGREKGRRNERVFIFLS